MRWDFWRRKPPHDLAPVEITGRGSASYAVYSRLLKERIVFIASAIDDEVANVVMAQLLYLQHEDPKADVTLYIDCPGGSVTASFAIYDTMQFVKNDVATYCIGQAAGTALLLLCAGEPGKRFALPEGRLVFTEIASGSGTADEHVQKIQEEEIGRLKKAISETFARHAPLAHAAFETTAERFLTPAEGVSFGLIDGVVPTASTR